MDLFSIVADSDKVCTSVFLEKEGKVILGLRHYTPEKFKTVSLWTTPGGRCEAGENVVDSLLREVMEETGITNVQLHKYLGTVPGAKEGDVVHVYVGATSEDPALMEPEKFSEWELFDAGTVPDNFINPAALALYQKSIA
jgi:ADP-ribose pyrophosphatase YjhB (NUDIX family)